MDKKETKSSKSPSELEAILMQNIESIKGLSSKKMFGGYGIFHENKMFGIVSAKSEIFFKANEDTKATHESEGGVRHSRMSYYSVPEKILHQKKTLTVWAKKSIAISK